MSEIKENPQTETLSVEQLLLRKQTSEEAQKTALYFLNVCYKFIEKAERLKAEEVEDFSDLKVIATPLDEGLGGEA